MCHIGQYSVFCGQWASHHKSTPRPLSVDTLQIQPASKWSITKILTKITIAAISAPPCHVRYIFIIHSIFFLFLRFLTRRVCCVLCYSLMSMSNNNICQSQMKFLTMQWIFVPVLDIFKNSSQSCFVLWHIAIVTNVTWSAPLCHSEEIQTMPI